MNQKHSLTEGNILKSLLTFVAPGQSSSFPITCLALFSVESVIPKHRFLRLSSPASSTLWEIFFWWQACIWARRELPWPQCSHRQSV